MLQANNQAMGSPSNRINIHAHFAADGLAAFTPAASRTLAQIGLKTYALETFRLVIFRVVLFAVDIGFQITRLRSWITEKMGGKGEGLEDLLQRQVTVSLSLSPFFNPVHRLTSRSLHRRTWLVTNLVSSKSILITLLFFSFC